MYQDLGKRRRRKRNEDVFYLVSIVDDETHSTTLDLVQY